MDLQLICIASSYVIIFGILFFIVAQKRKLQAKLEKKTRESLELKEEYEESKQVTDSFCQKTAEQVQILFNEMSELSQNNEQLRSKLHGHLLETIQLQAQVTMLQMQKTMMEDSQQEILDSNAALLKDNRILLDREKKWMQVVKELMGICEAVLKSVSKLGLTAQLTEQMRQENFKDELDTLLSNLQIKRNGNGANNLNAEGEE